METAIQCLYGGGPLEWLSVAFWAKVKFLGKKAVVRRLKRQKMQYK
jgi:hypothetical protein